MEKKLQNDDIGVASKWILRIVNQQQNATEGQLTVSI